MSRADEGLITAVNAQSAWLVRFAICFLRAMLLPYVCAVAFDHGMLAKYRYDGTGWLVVGYIESRATPPHLKDASLQFC